MIHRNALCMYMYTKLTRCSMDIHVDEVRICMNRRLNVAAFAADNCFVAVDLRHACVQSHACLHADL